MNVTHQVVVRMTLKVLYNNVSVVIITYLYLSTRMYVVSV